MIPEEHKQAHEVQLTGWGEGMRSGPWVKFRVDAEAYERFKAYNIEGKNQQRFHLVAVPIDDNEEPKPAPKKHFNELSRAQQAGILCADKGFQDWLYVNYGGGWSPHGDTAGIVRRHCQVESRRELDEDVSRDLWDALVTRYREETQIPEQR